MKRRPLLVVAFAGALAMAGAPSAAALTSAQLQTLRAEISACWNVGSLSPQALEAKIVVQVSLTPKALPITESIQMVEHEADNEAAANEAFVIARRAIIRCGQNGFSLPPESYAEWKDIVMTFDARGLSQ